MTFRQDLNEGTKAEMLLINHFRINGKGLKQVRQIGCNVPDGIKKRNLGRIAGDIRILTEDNRICRVEVKRDKSANRTGNLFLERYSDNGERTNNITIGWFDNEESKYSHYAFMIVSRGTLLVKKDELKELVKETNPRVIPMMYNQQQRNRSDGYLVKIDDVLSQCKSAKMMEGVYC